MTSQTGSAAKPNTGGDIAVEADRISKIFQSGGDEVRALDDVSVAIRRNEFFTLLGPSGCGKTTLLRVIAGFEPPTMGVLRLGGRDISRLPPNQRPVNTVFQNYALFPHMSVANNIAFGLEMLGKPKGEIAKTVDEMLHLVQMEALKSRRTSEISGGQQQRVALARALAPHPEVLLLDEPLSALDLKLRKEMQIELKRLQSETGITFVFVTHDQGEALSMADRIAVFNEGRIMQTGTPEEIYRRPKTRFVADFVGSSNVLSPQLTERLAGVAEWSSLRPEDIRLGAEGGHEATVTGTSFLGSATRLTLDVTGEKISVLLPSGGRVPEQGKSVRFSWNSDALHLMGAKA